MSSSPVSATPKSERTRAVIREVALRSFRERGYDHTTIRLIAEEAGVSVGTTNYHFASKNDLVQELYLDVQQAHRDAALPVLETTTDLVERLGIVYRTGLAQLEPYHRFAPEFLSAAVSPRSSINPLSGESSESRDIVVGLFQEAVSGAADRLPRSSTTACRRPSCSATCCSRSSGCTTRLRIANAPASCSIVVCDC